MESFNNNVVQLLHAISDQAYLLDRDGYVALANEAWLKYLGLNPNAVVGRHLKSVIWDCRFTRQLGGEDDREFPAEDAQDSELLPLRAAETGKPAACLSEDRMYHTYAYPLRDGSGGPAGVFVIRHAVFPEGGGEGETPETSTMLGNSPAMLQLRRLGNRALLVCSDSGAPLGAPRNAREPQAPSGSAARAFAVSFFRKNKEKNAQNARSDRLKFLLGTTGAKRLHKARQ